MKEIKAIIQPFMLNRVIDAIHADPDLPGVTVSEVIGFGRQRAVDTPADQKVILEGFGYAKKTKLEIIVPDDLVETVRQLILKQARTGNPGDGLISVIPLESATRVRTGAAVGSPA